KGDIGKAVQSREREAPRWGGIEITIIANAELVLKSRAKGMVLVDGDQVIFERNRFVERGQVRVRVDSDGAVVNVAAAELVLTADVEIDASEGGPVVGIVRAGEVQNAF